MFWSMSTVPVSLEEYLNTAYSPDREYVDGEIVRRNVGARGHSFVRSNLIFLLRLGSRRLFVWPEQRVRTIAGRRCRVPDVCVTIVDPHVDVFESPPLVCIESLSRKDRLSRVVAKCEQYAAFGVPHIWVFDPRRKKAFRFEEGRLEEAQEKLAVPSHRIQLPLKEIFRGL